MNVASSSSTTAAAAAVRFHSCRCFLHPFSSSSSSSKVLIPSYWGRSWWRSSHMQSISSSALFTTNTAASGSSSPVTTGEYEFEVVKPKPIEKPQPWLIVGLGNPGKMYNRTRHNVGFEMVDAIAGAEGIAMGSVSFRSLFGKGYIGDTPVMLAKPQTFMNCSGESVGALVSYYKIPVKQVLLIYDDLDLPFAKLRLLPRGGHGGHNGMKSVINHFKGNRDFPRLRIGIGRPPGKMDAANFVLRQFSKQEREELDFTLQTGVEAMRILLLKGFSRSATFVNTAKSLEPFR